MWEELGKLQIQPRLYQIVEVCEKINEAQPYLIRLCYTSPKVPHRVLVHYLGDTRPYLVKECEIFIDDYTGEPSYRNKGICKLIICIQILYMKYIYSIDLFFFLFMTYIVQKHWFLR